MTIEINGVGVIDVLEEAVVKAEVITRTLLDGY
jgi:hypothetical protein